MVDSIADQWLEGLTRANVQLLGALRLPPLYASGVRWSLKDIGPIPFAQTILRRGRGACGPLAAWRAAELRRSGENARAFVRPSSSGVPGRWHAVVMRGDGTIEDPSRIVERRAVVGFAPLIPLAAAAAPTLLKGLSGGGGGGGGKAGKPALLRLKVVGRGPTVVILRVPVGGGGEAVAQGSGGSPAQAAMSAAGKLLPMATGVHKAGLGLVKGVAKKIPGLGKIFGDYARTAEEIGRPDIARPYRNLQRCIPTMQRLLHGR